jgi:hypothetical protein
MRLAASPEEPLGQLISLSVVDGGGGKPDSQSRFQRRDLRKGEEGRRLEIAVCDAVSGRSRLIFR